MKVATFEDLKGILDDYKNIQVTKENMLTLFNEEISLDMKLNSFKDILDIKSIQVEKLFKDFQILNSIVISQVAFKDVTKRFEKDTTLLVIYILRFADLSELYVDPFLEIMNTILRDMSRLPRNFVNGVANKITKITSNNPSISKELNLYLRLS